MFTRRKMLSLSVKAVGGMAGAMALRKFPLARAKGMRSRTQKAPPRYHVELFLPGGIDAIYTLDPKVKSEVASGVDVPYKPHQIVHAGKLRLGPHFAPLAKWASEMAVVKGVGVSTANHVTGEMQSVRLRTKTTEMMPSIYEILGAHRDSQPLSSVTLGSLMTQCHDPGWFGQPGSIYGAPENRLLRHVDKASPEDLRILSKVLKREAQGLVSRTGQSEALTSGQNLGEAADFFAKVADVPRFVKETWDGVSPDAGTQDTMLRMQRALWLLENDLTASVVVTAADGAVWDTHTDNARRQEKFSKRLVPLMARFISELHKRTNRHGRLSDNTLLLAGSELGRFPYLNAAAGKDHFPEAPFLLMGPWVRGGRSYGTTGKSMDSVALDPATGRAVRTGGHHLMLDDVGTTVLGLSHVDPEMYGYNGHYMKFMLQG